MPKQDPELTVFARDMRKDPTKGENELWWSLRGRGLGVKFRRQVPIGTYIADFACFSHRTILEVDGVTHDFQEINDQRRDRWFRSKGWTVIRGWDDDVLENRDGVLELIRTTLGLEP